MNGHRRKESGFFFSFEKAHFIYRSDARNIHRSQTKRQETRGPPDGHKQSRHSRLTTCYMSVTFTAWGTCGWLGTSFKIVHELLSVPHSQYPQGRSWYYQKVAPKYIHFTPPPLTHTQWLIMWIITRKQTNEQTKRVTCQTNIENFTRDLEAVLGCSHIPEKILCIKPDGVCSVVKEVALLSSSYFTCGTQSFMKKKSV